MPTLWASRVLTVKRDGFLVQMSGSRPSTTPRSSFFPFALSQTRALLLQKESVGYIVVKKQVFIFILMQNMIQRLVNWLLPHTLLQNKEVLENFQEKKSSEMLKQAVPAVHFSLFSSRISECFSNVWHFLIKHPFSQIDSVGHFCSDCEIFTRL